MTIQQTLIIGANSEIAKSIAIQQSLDTSVGLILISRKAIHEESLQGPQVSSFIVTDYSEHQIDQVISKLTLYENACITKVIICNGILHSPEIKPEKRIEDFLPNAFTEVMQSNALTPMLWIKKLLPILTGKSPCKIAVFSARVGSISDNRLGGWYSYRASKAALNMMLKTAAIELARRDKNIKLLAFHPGTTDTPLSKPFQRNVPANKLFTSSYVAEQFLSIVEQLPFDQKASYLDWQGKTIEW